jgi:hypothetical protein
VVAIVASGCPHVDDANRGISFTDFSGRSHGASSAAGQASNGRACRTPSRSLLKTSEPQRSWHHALQRASSVSSKHASECFDRSAARGPRDRLGDPSSEEVAGPSSLSWRQGTSGAGGPDTVVWADCERGVRVVSQPSSPDPCLRTGRASRSALLRFVRSGASIRIGRRAARHFDCGSGAVAADNRETGVLLTGGRAVSSTNTRATSSTSVRSSL